MFGKQEIPLIIQNEHVSLSAEIKQGMMNYSRVCNDDELKKAIVSKAKSLLITPVEPTNTPKTISSHLLIEFENPLIIEPQSRSNIYLQFPIEIGVFLKHGKKTPVIDIFCPGKQKFVLYGKPDNGIICKHWKSPTYRSIPETNPFVEGVIELSINNKSSNWAEISKAVFSAFGMKIFYDEKLVSMKAKMIIENGGTAETDFEASPLNKNMQKAIEVYTLSKLSISSSRYRMEYGL